MEQKAKIIGSRVGGGGAPKKEPELEKQPLELEHLIGFTGKYLNTVKYHSQENDAVVYTVGTVLVAADLADPHKQRFFRGHDANVSCFAVSPCGKMLASGQIASTRYKGQMAPVIVWGWGGKVLGQFPGLTAAVVSLAFSPDSRFLLGSGANKMMYVWDLETGEVQVAQKVDKVITSATWGPMSRGKSRRHPTYSLITCPSPIVRYHILEFEAKSMQYVLKSYPCQFPSRGLTRTYHCVVMDEMGESAITGTEVGDLLVFNVRSTVFRTRIPISSNGISSICHDKNNVVFVAGGDGTVKKLQGKDREWRILAETKIPGRIVSMDLSAKGDSLVAGTPHGSLYKLDTQNLKYLLASESHITSINDIAFGKDPTKFATIAEDGLLRMWDLGKYRVLLAKKGSSAGRRVLIHDRRAEIIVGWADGSVHGYAEKNGKLTWQVPNAHRGAVTCMDLGQGNLITGGEDGAVRIWQIPEARLVTQYQAHTGAVGEVLADISAAHLVHSFGASDRSIATYNAKKAQKVIAHMIQNGAFSSMTQRADSEQELVTGLSHGYILFWDCDEKNPVGNVLDQGRSRISAIALSPDCKFLAVSGVDSRLRVYDVKTMKVIARCEGHAGTVNRVAFTPDQRQLVTVGTDAAICVWNWYA